MPQFDLELLSPLVFWSIISFGILLFILYKFVLPPVLGILDERREKIQGDIEKGERLVAEMETKKTEYQKKLDQAETEANRRIKEAIKEAKTCSDEIIQDAKRKTDAMRQKAEQDIRQEKKKALAEIHNQVVSLSVVTASKILRHTIDEETARKLADEVIEDLGEIS